VLAASMFMVQSMTSTAYAAFAKAGDCSTACAFAGALDGFAFAFAEAWGTLASASAG
jgi:uncharacterized membrane protein YjfL (UPF0719 family)